MKRTERFKELYKRLDYYNQEGRILNVDLYQELAGRTMKDEPFNMMVVESALGLCGESGEVADIIKKAEFHGHELDEKDVIKELGDVMWYVALMCTALGIPMSEVITKNIEKLKKRYPDGFSEERSINRDELQEG